MAPEKRRITIVASIIILLLAFGGIAGYAYWKANKIGVLSTQVNAEGWNKDTSTPIELAIYQGNVADALTDDDQTNDPQAYKELVVDANCKWDLTDITERGDYTLEVKATPILEDGTMFKLPEPQVVTLEGNDVTATFDLEKLDLATASSEELAEVAQAAEAAAEDTGDTNKVAAVAAATQKTTEKATSAGNSNASAASSAISKPSTPSGNTSGGSHTGSQAGSESTGGSDTSGGSTEPSQPTHTHTWVPQYTTEQVPIYDTVTVVVCDTCGARNVDMNHMYQHAINGENDATHNEYEQVIVGYDKKQVLTGYKCSGCGATK